MQSVFTTGGFIVHSKCIYMMVMANVTREECLKNKLIPTGPFTQLD